MRRGESLFGMWLLLRWQRLALSTVQHHWASLSGIGVSQMRICGMRRDKRLGLGRDWREQALLVEADAVAATSIARVFETGASNLPGEPMSVQSQQNRITERTFRLRQ